MYFFYIFFVQRNFEHILKADIVHRADEKQTWLSTFCHSKFSLQFRKINKNNFAKRWNVIMVNPFLSICARFSRFVFTGFIKRIEIDINCLFCRWFVSFFYFVVLFSPVLSKELWLAITVFSLSDLIVWVCFAGLIN